MHSPTKTESVKTRDLARSKAWRDANRERFRALIENRRSELREWYASFKSSTGCKDCGETDAFCLQFHHRDPQQKSANVARLISAGWCKERILQEIDKCDVLCFNCHLKAHSREPKPNPKRSLSIGCKILPNTRYLEFNGERHPASHWGRVLGIPIGTIFSRLNRGWSEEKVLSTPSRVYKKK